MTNNGDISDGLIESERILAWETAWTPSFSGIAIINADFTFRAVNQQFCEILGVTPGELINNSFTDITPQPVKNLDIANAKLVRDGVIRSYFLEKYFEFSNGKKVHVDLLVTGVYHKNTGEFLFYVTRIMEKGTKETSNTQPQKQTKSIFDYIDAKKIIMFILTTLALGFAYYLEKLFKLVP